MTHPLRIATRKSPLALWQAEHVKARLETHHPGLEVVLVPMTTQGDRWLGASLASVGGKGLFVKELERSLLEGEADIAVHSMKDVPVEIPEGLFLPVILSREDPRDALVSLQSDSLEAMPAGARIGTSSLRRQCQLRARYPHLQVIDLRGNVNTRLKRLEEGRFEAIILAAAGLKRLGLEGRITRYLSVEESLPAIGQGAIGLECRKGDGATLALITPLDDRTTHTCVEAERALNEELEGGCQVPLAAHATLRGQTLHLRAMVGKADGSVILEGTREGPADAPRELGQGLAMDLAARGALTILHG